MRHASPRRRNGALPSSSSRILTLTPTSPALRVRFGADDEGGVVLLSGAATLLGASMTPNMRYTYTHADVLIEAAASVVVSAVASNNISNNSGSSSGGAGSLRHARVQVSGNVEAMTCGVAAMRDALAIAALHAELHMARLDATMTTRSSSSSSLSSWRGPRVLVIGADARATMALCRTLVARAVRARTTSSSSSSSSDATSTGLVAFTDLDVLQQSLSCAGSVAATFVHTMSASEEALQSPPPLSFFVGDTAVTSASASSATVTATRRRYLDACVCLAESVASVATAAPALASNGLVVRGAHVPSSSSSSASSRRRRKVVAEAGMAASASTDTRVVDVLVEHVAMFALTHVVVVGPDSALEAAVASATVGQSVQRLRYTLPTSDDDDDDDDDTNAAVMTTTTTTATRNIDDDDSDSDDDEAVLASSVMRYLFGTTRTRLRPSRGVVAVADVVLLDALTLRTLAPRDVRARALAAVVYADGIDTVAVSNVAGYVVLLEVGERYVSLLAPAPGELPKPFLLVSPTLTLPPHCVPPLGDV